MSDPETTRPPAARPGGRTRGAGRLRPGQAPGAFGVAPFLEAQADEVDWQGSLGLNTAHCTIVVVDVEGFGRRSRTNPNKVRIRRGMYRALERAFVTAEIQWAGCRHVDLGDGVLVLAPAQISKTLFVDLLLEALTDELVAHNIAHLPPERIRLRLALHAGEVSYDDHGVTGSSILHAQQLLDAPELKQALAETKAVLAVIASDWVFDEVIRHSERSGADTYQAVETSGGRAWIRLLARRRDLARRRRLG
ncbi:hypothetical protein AB0C38_12095 [Amycolatopsis sp. NPDC048633]|uniref:hypothetical protein n=1 Tax=Amycolatopsis sp. NPDC048633 TaxID=3157095 RepID=UPI0033EEA486